MTNPRPCLGTASLGMAYGLLNAFGRQPTRAEAFRALDAAWEAGVRDFDTAAAYGEAEVILGAWGACKRGARVVTKLKPWLLENVVDARAVTMTAVALAARRLRGDPYAVLHHTSQYVYNPRACEALVRCREAGMVPLVGLSAYEPEQVDEAVKVGFDCVQAPSNALDQRVYQSGAAARAVTAGLQVYLRAPFCQGLLLLDPDAADGRVVGSGVYVRAFVHASNGADPVRAALAHARCIAAEVGADTVVFGAETPWKVVRDVAEFYLRWPLRCDLRTVVPPAICLPSLWAQRPALVLGLTPVASSDHPCHPQANYPMRIGEAQDGG